MKTKTIPAIIMLTAGLIASIAGIRSRMDIADFLKMLLIVLIIFYIIGLVVKLVLDIITAPKEKASEKEDKKQEGEKDDTSADGEVKETQGADSESSAEDEKANK